MRVGHPPATAGGTDLMTLQVGTFQAKLYPAKSVERQNCRFADFAR
jgi:hypothetical protein